MNKRSMMLLAMTVSAVLALTAWVGPAAAQETAPVPGPDAASPTGATSPAERTPQLMAQLGHADSIRAATYSPDGRYVVTIRHRTARLWDAQSGKELRRFAPHPREVISVAFSPDGRYILTGASGGPFWKPGNTAHLWDAETGREIHRVDLHYSVDGPYSVGMRFSPDGERVITDDESGVRVWDLKTGRELRRSPWPDTEATLRAISDDTRLILTSDESGAGHVWDSETFREIRRIPASGSDSGEFIASFSPDSQRLLTVGTDGTARMWNVATGAETVRFEVQSWDTFYNPSPPIAFSPDGSRVVMGQGRAADLWDLGTGRKVVDIKIEERGDLTAIAFSADGKHFLTANTQVQIRDAETGAIIRRLERMVPLLQSASFFPDGQRILVADINGSAQIWNAGGLDKRLRFEGHRGNLLSPVISADGRQILTGDAFDSIVRLWDAESGSEIKRFGGHSPGVSSVAFSADAKQVLVARKGTGIVHVHDADSGREIRRVSPSLPDDKFGISSAEISPFSNHALTMTRDWAYLWDLQTGNPLVSLLTLETYSGIFTSGGSHVLTFGSGVQLWDAASGEELLALALDGVDGFDSAALSPDRSKIVGGGGDGALYLWPVSAPSELLRVEGHLESIFHVDFSPRGDLILSASRDGTVRLRDPVSGSELCSLITFTDDSWAVVAPDGRYDASNPDEMEGLYWVVGKETMPLSRFKEQYYAPGLLGKILGMNKEPLRVVPRVAGSDTIASGGAAPSDVQRILDLELDQEARIEAFEQVLTEPEAARGAALRNLVASADDEFAAKAARELVERRVEGVENLISDRLRQLDVLHRMDVLGRANDVLAVGGSNADLVSIGRDVLKTYAEAELAPDAVTYDIELAALILARSSLLSDKELLRTLLRKLPQSRAL